MLLCRSRGWVRAVCDAPSALPVPVATALLHPHTLAQSLTNRTSLIGVK